MKKKQKILLYTISIVGLSLSLVSGFIGLMRKGVKKK